MTRSLLLSLVLGLALSSCKGLFQYSPNEIRLEEEEKNLNVRNIQKINAQPVKDSFRFIVVGDSQRFYDQLDDFVSAVNRMRDISFVLLNGDISDFGLNREFQLVNRSMSRLNVPYIAVVGNHDMLANGRLVYHQMFGAENFSFTHHNSKFICMNSNSLERGYDGTLPDMDWLASELSGGTEQRNIFVFSHIPPFDSGFDQNMVQSYAAKLSQNGKVRLSIHGHTHKYSFSAPYGEDVKYLVAGSVGNRSFALVTVNNDQYKVEEVAY
ncbi:MAG TPA: metallophosphoesterase [Flavisolibacter sp.]|nr:metallophosphoesterase [Flavisolibacter sp.]